MPLYQRRRSPIRVELPASGLALAASRHQVGFAMQPARQGYHKRFCITGGAGELLVERRRVPLVPGMLCYVPPQREHRLVDQSQNPVSLLVACFSRQFLDRALALHGAEGPPWPAVEALPLENAYYREQIEQCLLAMAFEQSERRPAWAGAMAGHFLTLLAFHQRAQAEAPPEDGDLQSCLSWLEHHFDRPVTVEDLARRCGLSYRRFTQRFRELTGQSLLAYQAALRIRHACRLLQNGLPIADAAKACGYHDIAHFYRQFKQLQGLPPGRWLELHEEPS